MKPDKSSFDFVAIFFLHHQHIPVYLIAKRLHIPALRISSIIKGIYIIPSDQINILRSLGFKICKCCNQRLVPRDPINYISLEKLCAICYQNDGNTDEEDFISAGRRYEVHLNTKEERRRI